MPPSTPRLRILSVGGNAVSAFLSWRLSATQACDVTLVWKNGFENVHQYGISFRSDKFGNERFKPRAVVRSPEDAAGANRASFDYVLLCVKALPDVYDLASVIESVVSPQHTCILVNTTHTLGIESYLEQRFPTNVVLSLVSGVEITQLGASEFEHKGSTELFVGAANKNPSIPASIQQDMAEALAMTLKSGQVDCEVAASIRQKQYERMIGPIAFYPASVLYETPVHAELLEKVGVRSLITGLIDEITNLAKAQGCDFPPGFREQTMEKMIIPSDTNSIMYQDFLARRPMEVETYLGSPVKIAQENGLQIPRIETLYSLLHNINIVNQTKPQGQAPPSPPGQATPRMSSAPMPNGTMHVNGRGPPPANGPPMRNGMRPPTGTRSSSASAGPPPPGMMRRGPPSMSGYPPPVRMNGYGPRGHPQQMSRRGSFEGNDLEEFSHVMLYDNMTEGGEDGYDGMQASSSGNLALRERELALRRKELELREREFHMRRGGPRMPPPRDTFDEDDEDGDDFFDAMAPNGPSPAVDADKIDMMSVTSRRTRKAPSASQLRSNPEMMSNGPVRHSRNPMRRPPKQNRTSAALMADMPGLREQLMNNPLMGYSSDRFGTVDRMNMGQESRANSLTAERLNELQHGGPPPGAYPPHNSFPMNRRGSQSPGNPLSPGQRPPQRPSPPNGYGPPAPHRNGRPSPPDMRQPVPRHPPGHGNAVAPQQIEQQTGVSNLYPPKSGPPNQVRSLTGSASASAGSGDSNRSAPVDSEPSAHSSSSSLGPRHAIGVR
ncbi:hypothetical protein DOTSEDRAFT_67869 [Dothistroma septosporum NZE10]|uniref:2-dehydropantoate 2-reductase-like protein n=1 Tax=Dothistroma septosporum (strain NZE10 / CBS 128990) TaxID=675120 RepID=N1Q115_DOTSN|nr:hypothetical protein DOTSEDRAFT_67869 [Dothistroma septosporum NZE10]